MREKERNNVTNVLQNSDGDTRSYSYSLSNYHNTIIEEENSKGKEEDKFYDESGNSECKLSYGIELGYLDLMEIIKAEFPQMYERQERLINLGQIHWVGQIEDILETLNQNADFYRNLFRHASKTYIRQPKFGSKLHVYWVLNNIERVLAEKAEEFTPQNSADKQYDFSKMGGVIIE